MRWPCLIEIIPEAEDFVFHSLHPANQVEKPKIGKCHSGKTQVLARFDA
jgi:hypothetical protein